MKVVGYEVLSREKKIVGPDSDYSHLKTRTKAQIHTLTVVSDTLDKIFSTLPEKDIETTKNVLRTILLNCGKEEVE